ncbi:stage II sporulation protein R [Clostridium grantii]|uniref:Stage II sporulation protein R n=1 Tax=Clostridium grantii DSM 8605 TaxID=1121316 RepID=A0A1M5TKU7_9CLOT|nr:stage II sporulation protein R [Clostridium grantii DSM 8605]
MKKICTLCFFGIIIGFIYLNFNQQSTNSIESISNKIIRFHVIANSDTTTDQALKLKVRNAVLEFAEPKLRNSKSIEESRKILKENDEEIKKISENIIKENGYQYSVITTLDNENFPVKTYGNITLPEGKYEAYRIVIGTGEGHNWWCVMFPPLCFTDITKGEVAYEETEEKMKEYLTDEEYNIVDNETGLNNNSIETTKINGEEVVIKFKVVEIFQEVKEKVGELINKTMDKIFSDK